ncbi:hypothetical protein NC652_023082 [Populus alba x Populus x berolinensis]|nr:hypothetical protein NC652_023082 [Populus alba x Populus x berolinensis]
MPASVALEDQKKKNPIWGKTVSVSSKEKKKGNPNKEATSNLQASKTLIPKNRKGDVLSRIS